MSEFVILHLSDAHIGNPRKAGDSRDVLKPLLKDLKASVALGWKPNLVVFTGDLAWGEIETGALKNQYAQAKDWLQQIYSSLDVTTERAPLLLVPGNHDVNRKTVGSIQSRWVDGLQETDGEALVGAEMRGNTADWQRLIQRQDEWWAFVTSFASSGWTTDERFRMCHRTFTVDEKKIGVVGVNTSWACCRDNEKNVLWVGEPQAQQAWQVIEDCDVRVVAAHHPPEWMHAGERFWTTEKIEGKFNVFFHGHEHSQWFRDSTGHLRVAAGPCYEGSTKENAYSWFKFDIQAGNARIRLRKYEQKGKGGWVPFAIPAKTDDQGEAEIINLFRSGVSAGGGGGSISPAPTVETGRMRTKPRKPVSAGKPREGVESVDHHLEMLQEAFDFIWEPAGFRKSAQPIVVYWPVRLRQPTPIHAVQAFAAGGFLRCGARVILCLDDLGNVETNRKNLEKTVRRWMKRVSADVSKLDVRSMAWIKRRTPNEIWRRIREWLAYQSQYDLLGVLEVSKLLPRGGHAAPLSDLAARKSRRLLTPAIVWTCLHHLMAQHGDCRFITLGGHDERILWKAWRDCIAEGAPKVGHLYVPELQGHEDGGGVRPLSMKRGTLAWDSASDIEDALKRELAASTSETFLARGRMARWCYAGCLQLPATLAGKSAEFSVDGKVIHDWEDLVTVSAAQIPHELAKAVEPWLL